MSKMISAGLPNENGHEWVLFEVSSSGNIPSCRFCMGIRRHDGKNSPCKGAARMRPYEESLPVRELDASERGGEG